ncbi:hypothetical protein BU23DRAFT_566567 [Bimuria novae-zelandiae CBS 107.79]|uniref:Uncharacterized protein n=1 Tax=Bimuria novae-zelandiae CBS 107.79 TaxID=1447943 RepID=A0A6A5VFE1_9PLEO|nr:hypothetical protein BU23DRAFT_566567 [Bimuria novae-zelandiae CBS 107.79]
MTSSCSTTLFAPSLPMKIIPYVPGAPKPKSKSKAKSLATAKTAEYSRGVGSSKDGGEWLYIDDFPMLDSNVSPPSLFEAAGTSGSVDHDEVDGLSATSELEKLEHYKLGRESLDEGGTDHVARVTEADLAIVRLLDRSSRNFPLIVESDEAEGHHSATDVEPSNGASNCQDNGYRASAGNGGYSAAQHGDLDAVGERAFSIEDVENICPDSLLAQDELLLGDIDVTDELSAIRKRTRPEALDVMPESALEDPCSLKRRRLARRQVENLILGPVATHKSTALPTPSGDVSRSRASNEPSLGPLDSGNERDGVGTLRLSPSDLRDDEDGGDSAHSRRTSEELLYSLRGSISPSERIEREQDIGLDSERREEYREGGGGDASESHKDPRNQDDDISRRPSAKIPQRRTRSGHLPQKKRNGPSRTALGRQGSRTMRTRASRQVASSKPGQLYRPPIDNRPRSRSPQTSSRGTKARDRRNIHYGPSLNMSYQITDLTLCPVPKGSSIVTAIFRYRDSKLSLDPVALDHKLLGGEGKVIRMTQLSPDSWMLLGYRYDDGASGPCTRGSLNADWMSNLHSDAASHETDHPDDDWDENSEKEEGTEARGKRKRKPWLESDEVRLLSFRDKQGMEWKEICERFPGRTPGAVKLRYYTLQKKGS